MTPPGLYRHWKGDMYRVLSMAHNSTNGSGHGRTLVVYLSLTTGRINARDEDEFHERVNPTRESPDGVKRFVFVGEGESAVSKPVAVLEAESKESK